MLFTKQNKLRGLLSDWSMYFSCLVCDWLIKVYEKLPGMISNRMSLDASASQQQNKKIQQTLGFFLDCFWVSSDGHYSFSTERELTSMLQLRFTYYCFLGTGNASQSINPQICSVRPWVVDRGSSLYEFGGGLSDYNTETLVVNHSG